jgi:hypothetical protein
MSTGIFSDFLLSKWLQATFLKIAYFAQFVLQLPQHQILKNFVAHLF